MSACFLCAGQSCTAGERLLVHEAVRDEFVERWPRPSPGQVRLGDPFDDATTMGPVNNEPVAAKMDEHVADAVERGATVVAGGSRAAGLPDRALLAAHGARRRAARLDRGRREETFGPIAPIVPIGSLEQAIELTNASVRTGCWRRSSRPTWRAGCASRTRSASAS